MSAFEGQVDDATASHNFESDEVACVEVGDLFFVFGDGVDGLGADFDDDIASEQAAGACWGIAGDFDDDDALGAGSELTGEGFGKAFDLDAKGSGGGFL